MKKPVINDAELLDLLQHNIPVERIALLCRVPESQIEKQIAALEHKRQEEDRKNALRARSQENPKGRPLPPPEMAEDEAGDFVTIDSFRPSPELTEWAIESFLSEGGPLYNPEHAHLSFTTLGFLWSSVPYRKQGRIVNGLAEMPQAQGASWTGARSVQQMLGWFDCVPTFLITLSASHAAKADDASFCALVEHELLHCGHKLDRYGYPKYDMDGLPVLGLRGHDAEEFISVVRRYGPGAAAGGVAELVQAASRPPLIGAATIAQACGNCLR